MEMIWRIEEKMTIRRTLLILFYVFYVTFSVMHVCDTMLLFNFQIKHSNKLHKYV